MRYPMDMPGKPRPVRLFESAIPSGNAYKVQRAASTLGLSGWLERVRVQPGYVPMRPDPLGKKPTLP